MSVAVSCVHNWDFDLFSTNNPTKNQSWLKTSRFEYFNYLLIDLNFLFILLYNMYHCSLNTFQMIEYSAFNGKQLKNASTKDFFRDNQLTCCVSKLSVCPSTLSFSCSPPRRQTTSCKCLHIPEPGIRERSKEAAGKNLGIVKMNFPSLLQEVRAVSTSCSGSSRPQTMFDIGRASKLSKVCRWYMDREKLR